MATKKTKKNTKKRIKTTTTVQKNTFFASLPTLAHQTGTQFLPTSETIVVSLNFQMPPFSSLPISIRTTFGLLFFTKMRYINPLLLSRRSRQRQWLHALGRSICSSLCRQIEKTQFSQKLSNLELWSLLTTYRKSYMGFTKNQLRDP